MAENKSGKKQRTPRGLAGLSAQQKRKQRRVAFYKQFSRVKEFMCDGIPTHVAVGKSQNILGRKLCWMHVTNPDGIEKLEAERHVTA